MTSPRSSRSHGICICQPPKSGINSGNHTGNEVSCQFVRITIRGVTTIAWASVAWRRRCTTYYQRTSLHLWSTVRRRSTIQKRSLKHLVHKKRSTELSSAHKSKEYIILCTLRNTMKLTSSFSIVDLGDDWAAVDAWESSGILSAAEAYEADKETSEVKRKLEDEEKRHELLADSARDHIDELASLLKKVELSTATKAEMERLSKLDKHMELLKADMKTSKSAIRSYTEEMLKSMSKTKTYALMKTEKEIDIRSVIRMVREAETVDLAFLLDCTSSMGSHIEAAKASMKDIVRRVKRTNQGLQFRAAVVGYRDIGDSPRFEVLDFTTSVEEFETFVSALRPIGGADAPEDMAGAVQKACTLSWKQASRITFVIADAPCHGKQYHSCGDSYPTGTPGICIESELKKLLGMGGQAGMQLHFGRITSYCDQMVRVFGDKGINFEVCDLKDPGKLASTVTTSVRKSISKSITASRSKSKSKTADGTGGFDDCSRASEYKICDAKPSVDEWKSLTAQPVKVLCNKPISSINDLKAPLHFGMIRLGKSASTATEAKKMFMLRAKHPFAQGELRLAYYAKLGTNESSLSSPDGKGDKVLKSFKKESSDRKDYLSQMEVSTIAHFLAEEYNKKSRPSHCPEVKFLTVNVVEAEGESRYCAEDQLPGAATSFTKYSNNTGYWNEDEINQSLLLFTRFTYETTRGYLMVTDLQGVRDGNSYILTDPAILCKDKTRFGGTNLGTEFIDKCMKATDAMLEEYGWDD